MRSQAEVDALVESVRGTAHMLANGASRIHNGIYDKEDLLQAALMGAVAAAHVYDADHESSASFNTYAIWRMKQEISNVWRKSGPAHVTKRDYEAMAAI